MKVDKTFCAGLALVFTFVALSPVVGLCTNPTACGYSRSISHICRS
ncbi:MAG TPA: hypothetical protein PKI32_00560 [Opitutales bacterium]|nr:hypothetical protein [Opitutales bacterium]